MSEKAAAYGRSTAPNGQFLWANPFSFDTKNFILSGIDVKTGRAHINEDLIVDEPGQRRLIYLFNTRSYWPTAYHPGNNSLYVPYYDICLDQTSAAPATADKPATRERRVGGNRPGSDPNNLVGLAKINMSTGEIQRFSTGSRATSSGAVLATAGDLICWGDLNRRFRAFDADTDKIVLGADCGWNDLSQHHHLCGKRKPIYLHSHG
jgi:hypothetical protein